MYIWLRLIGVHVRTSYDEGSHVNICISLLANLGVAKYVRAPKDLKYIKFENIIKTDGRRLQTPTVFNTRQPKTVF